MVHECVCILFVSQNGNKMLFHILDSQDVRALEIWHSINKICMLFFAAVLTGACSSVGTVAAVKLKLWQFSSFACRTSQWGTSAHWEHKGGLKSFCWFYIKVQDWSWWLTVFVYSARYRGAQICLWAHGSCCATRLSVPGRITLVRTYSAQHQPGPSPPTNPTPPDGKGGAEVVKERALAAFRV